MAPLRTAKRTPTSRFLDQLAAVLPPGIEPDLLLDEPRAPSNGCWPRDCTAGEVY